MYLAQRDPLATGTAEVKEKQVITGLLDGSGEYTLVYEDEEGDRMLVGDVPWKYVRVLRHLFIFSFRLKFFYFSFTWNPNST